MRKLTKKRFKRKMKLIKDGRISSLQALKILSSYKGHLKWGNCYNLLSKAINK